MSWLLRNFMGWKWLREKIVKGLFPTILDKVIDYLYVLARKTETKFDDKIVDEIKKNRELLLECINGFITGNTSGKSLVVLANCIFDIILVSLTELSTYTENDIDDKIVHEIKKYKKNIVKYILKWL